MQIPQNVVDEILDLDIVKEIQEDITLRKTGVNYVGICPFHGDKTPSMYVSPAKRIFKCFACGEGGNIISWRMKNDGSTFVQAVKDLAKRNNINVPEKEMSSEELEHFKFFESLKTTCKIAQDIFTDNFRGSSEAIQYIASRQISEGIIKEYGIGYADKNLETKLRNKSVNIDHAKQVGLIKDGEHGTYAYFQDRVLFPYMNKRGEVIGWTGRDITGKQEKGRKYFNTGETPLFKKGNNLYGYYQARKATIKEDKIYIVEGQFDVLSMAEQGVRNVVAGSGTAFTAEQRKLLMSLTTNVVFIYDGDAAGIHAAEKNLLDMVKEGFQIRCIALPDGQDPDDMAKALKGNLPEYLKKSESTYVRFLSEHLYNPKLDEYEVLAVTKKIVTVIANEKEEIIKQRFLQELTTYSKYCLQDLQKMLDDVKVPEVKETFEDGFTGLDEIQEFVDKAEPIIHLTNDFKRFLAKLGDKQPWVYYKGVADIASIQKLQSIASHVIFDNYEFECDSRLENSDCKLMLEMFKFGMKVEVYSETSYKSFINYYIQYYADYIRESQLSVEASNEIILRCAEVISFAKETVRTISFDSWAKTLGLKPAALKEIVKPYVNERKSKAKISRDTAIDESIILNTESIPAYVEQNEKYKKMLQQFNFYPVINKEGTPVCYMFKTESGSFKRVGDFYMEPLLHVYSENGEENKRIIKLNSLVTKKSKYVEWQSKTLTKLSNLSEALFNEGGYNFYQGTAIDYEKIKTCLSYEFKQCLELKTFGQQDEGFFCFANAIYHNVEGEWKIEMADELGIMEDNDVRYYSPAFSKMHAIIRKDNDPYEQIRTFVYKEVPEKDRLSFKQWASLMNEVYKINNNGKWAIMYAIISAFRSDIHCIHRYFTTLFFTGPTGSGKTQIAVSARSLFMTSDVACDNFNNTSDAAFFSKLEKFRDVPVVFEEYNDDQISDKIFQGLKQIVYDGDGKTKRKSASTNDVETSKVNSPVILLGQFAPSKDDGSLCNRIVLLEVPKQDDRSQHETDIFRELKMHERKGLFNILLEVLKLRPLVKKYFASLLDETIDELKEEMKQRGKVVDLRLINTNSIFIAMVKLMKLYAAELELPFTLEEFKEISISKIVEQSNLLKQTDKIAMFFARISTLIDKGIVKVGRDFKVVTCKDGIVALKDGEKEVSKGTRLLYINLSNIYDYYSNAGSLNGEKPMKLTDLRGNMHSHPSYIGDVSATRWAWMEAEEQPVAAVTNIDEDSTGKNMTVVRNMVKRSKSSSAMVLNYDILEKMGIAWLREFNRESNGEEVNPVDDMPF